MSKYCGCLCDCCLRHDLRLPLCLPFTLLAFVGIHNSTWFDPSLPALSSLSAIFLCITLCRVRGCVLEDVHKWNHVLRGICCCSPAYPYHLWNSYRIVRLPHTSIDHHYYKDRSKQCLINLTVPPRVVHGMLNQLLLVAHDLDQRHPEGVPGQAWQRKVQTPRESPSPAIGSALSQLETVTSSKTPQLLLPSDSTAATLRSAVPSTTPVPCTIQ
jgi:hypothetical protein